jgi:hypothetical protein
MTVTRIRVLGAGMARVHRMIAVATLALALVLAGQVRAMPLTGSSNATAVVLCSDEGMAMIYLDASGAPAGSPADCRTCPECNGTPALFTLPSPASPSVRDEADVDRLCPVAQVLPPARQLRPETRGPPPVDHGAIPPAPAAMPQIAASRHPSGMCHRIGRPLMEART